MSVYLNFLFQFLDKLKNNRHLLKLRAILLFIIQRIAQLIVSTDDWQYKVLYQFFSSIFFNRNFAIYFEIIAPIRFSLVQHFAAYYAASLYRISFLRKVGQKEQLPTKVPIKINRHTSELGSLF